MGEEPIFNLIRVIRSYRRITILREELLQLTPGLLKKKVEILFMLSILNYHIVYVVVCRVAK